jgi:hypothetical protein
VTALPSAAPYCPLWLAVSRDGKLQRGVSAQPRTTSLATSLGGAHRGVMFGQLSPVARDISDIYCLESGGGVGSGFGFFL